MEKYKNLGRDSNVDSYEIGIDFIRVKFNKTAKVYSYSYNKAGRNHVEQMKVLARNGSGLNSYIIRYVKKLYD